MTQELINAFVEAAKNNPELQNKLKAGMSFDEMITTASKMGFDLSALKSSESLSDSLSDADLENVAGGGETNKPTMRYSYIDGLEGKQFTMNCL